MPSPRWLLFVVVLIVLTGCGRGGGAAARGARRSASRSMERAFANLRRDAARDRLLPAKALTRPRSVFRYTSPAQAAREAKVGIPARSHFTSRAGPGRPLSGSAAQKRYGLPRIPLVRERITLPAGQPVRAGRAIGGSPGIGELTSPKPLPPGAVRGSVRLKKGK